MPTEDDPRWERADQLYREGCELVERADQFWADAHDPERSPDFRRVSRAAYDLTAAKARTRFRRHDALLTAADRARHEQQGARPGLSALIPYASGLTRQENTP